VSSPTHSWTLPGFAQSRTECRAALVESERVYTRIITNAAAARRRQLRSAIDHGLSIDEIAALTQLEPAHVEAIVAAS
jgi:DNA-binding transcriptional MerR regulator